MHMHKQAYMLVAAGVGGRRRHIALRAAPVVPKRGPGCCAVLLYVGWWYSCEACLRRV